MAHYEYKVIPAPVKAQKAKGVKTAEGRFAHTVQTELNKLGAEGWEYQRAELLPQEERSGLTSTQTTWRTVMVFRRLVGDELQSRVMEAPEEPQVHPHPALTEAQPAAQSDLSDETVVPLHAPDETPPGDDTPPRP